MKAAYLQNHHIHVGDVPDPVPVKGQALVRTHSCGLCASDAHFVQLGSKVVEMSQKYGGPFGEALWAELRPHGVDVLNLVLGRTDTPEFRRLLAEKGMPVPDNIASSNEVARIGLQRLPHGPVYNWGQADDAAGFAPNSAAARRERIVMIDRISQQIFNRA